MNYLISKIVFKIYSLLHFNIDDKFLLILMYFIPLSNITLVKMSSFKFPLTFPVDY